MVHFSDIHFREKDSENHLIQKSEKIISAIKANTSKSSQIICLMNGDVAFKGHQDEYFHAYTFFEDLRDKVRKDSNIDTIFVPGNHDCDFTKQSPQVREALIQKVYDSKDDMHAADELIREYMPFIKSEVFKFTNNILLVPNLFRVPVPLGFDFA